MVNNDGRHIDTSVALLEGEAAQQQPETREPVVWQQNATRDEPTYYDQPAIKEPQWIWTIPTYFYVGGMGGASMVMGAVAQIAAPEMRGFVDRCRWVGAIGGAASTALLIADLGRPTRFLYMLRVFRPTSPMSVGSWVLATAAPLAMGSALTANMRGPLRKWGNRAGIGAGIVGMPLAAYTAVLLANTAVPVWNSARKSLPVLFMAGSMTSMASAMQFFPLSRRERAVVQRFWAVGAAAELIADHFVEAETATVPQVGKALREGVAGALWQSAKVLTIAGAALAVTPGRSRTKRIAAGVLGALGAISMRFAIYQAGKASARDPRATFRQQRAGFGGGEVWKP